MSSALTRFGRLGLAYIFTATGLWLLVLMLLPLIVTIDYAFRPFLPPVDWGGPNDRYTFDNFAVVLLNKFNQTIFLKTIWASVLVTVLSLAACYPVAYTLAREKRSGRARWLAIALIIPFLVNELLRAFAWQLLLSYKGLFNQVLMSLGFISEPFDFINKNVGVIVGLVYTYLLFMILPLYTALESLDPNLVDAARDLGAPWWRIHWDVVLPHAKPGLANGCIVTFMLAAGSFAVPQLLGGTGSLWFTQLIYNQFNAINWNMGAAYAFCLVILCLVFIVIVMWLLRVRLSDIAR
ncbi:ABC transporter permease [Lichenifustis flavocetrariae]|uniref:ABC transporter permease n=1 Tax=Lichenifustis flavocetrariae TaxID=2949735 RepID=A0AA41Z1V5_9HYPH|nr:ABC transporter permease [Lichenifustis flavocetrariae]MCW6511452.1 ABC transporter permease [Lichenifustis flavocetrariae]